MVDTQNSGWDSWLMARVGNAIDIGVDRVLQRPQFGSDPAQAYGVDQNGRIYQLGQTNGQIRATVQTNVNPMGNMGTLLLLGLIALVVMESK